MLNRQDDNSMKIMSLVEEKVFHEFCVCKYTLHVKIEHTFSFSGFSVFLLISILYTNTEDIQTMK